MLSLIVGVAIGVVVTGAFCLLRIAWSSRDTIMEGETHNRLESLHAIPLPIAISENGRIVFTNTAWREDLPHAPDAGDFEQWLTRVMPSPNRSATNGPQPPSPAAAIAQGSVRAERCLKTASGTVLQWIATPFRGVGRRLVLNIIQDVTQLSEGNLEPATFLDKAAHELKTPVTAIRGYSELLGMYIQQEREINPKVVDRIIHQSDRLVRLTNELLDVGRLAAGRLKDDATPTFLPEVVDERVARFRRDHPERAIHVASDSIHTLIDPDRFAQVLDELLSNALQFSDAPDPVDVYLTLRERTLYLTVSDQGMGIAPEEQNRVSEKFFRASNVVHAKRAEGFGLGLYLVAAIAERWGGHVELESTVGKGTRVTVVWPHREVFQQSEEPLPPAPPLDVTAHRATTDRDL